MEERLKAFLNVSLMNKMVERPSTKYRQHGFVSARDFIENAWGHGVVNYTFTCTETNREVFFKLKDGPYRDYLIMEWTSKTKGGRLETEDVYIIAALWEDWESKFKCPPFQVNRASDVNANYLSQLNRVTLDVEAFFGLSYCARP